MNNKIKIPSLTTKNGKIFLYEYLKLHKKKNLKNAENINEINFLSFCLNNLEFSYSQTFQDLYVLYKLNSKKSGYFVEFGSCDGIKNSNSYLMEKKYNWDGIVCEPLYIWHKMLLKNRNCKIDFSCIYSSSNLELDFIVALNKIDLSTIKKFIDSDNFKNRREKKNKTIKVKTLSLNDLLKKYKTPKFFDYLSIDTEGSEYEILKTFDFEKYSPKIITVEHNFNKINISQIKKILNKNKYIQDFEIFSEQDLWFYKNNL